MHPKMVDEIVKACRQRDHEGDCPITPPFNQEQLEDCIIQLASDIERSRDATLKTLGDALKILCPDVIPVIVAAHAKYHEKLAARDEAFESLLAAITKEK